MNQLPNLLIVDDTEENLLLLEFVVKSINVNLIKANNGIEALEKTRGIELALAIIDVRMPIMDGFELARKLNEIRSDAKVPIIFLTANYDRDATEGYESGAVDYIYKPLHRRILLSKINVFLDLFNQKQSIVQNTVLLKESSDELKKSLDQLHNLAKYTEKAREYERKSIARELHDDLGQALTAVKIDLGIIKRSVNEENLLVKIDKLSALVGDTIKAVQRLTSQLRPEIIDDLGLEAAIEWYTKEFGTRNNIDIFLDIESGIPVSPDDSITLFRIMQESLTNIARHSGANRVEISLFCSENTINFKISDNGIGIPDLKLSSKKSFGLIGMRERAIALGGTFQISNESGKGTVVSLIFPIDHPGSDLVNE
ncbi:MAG: response regulator [Prolixibacteraceae bacterium]|jgi:signal transduction histidine kinase